MLESVKSHKTTNKIGELLGLIGLSFGLDALVTYLAMRTSLYFWIALGLGIVLVGVFCFTRLELVITAVRSRQAVYGMNVTIAAILVIGIAVVVNVIAGLFFDKEMDWTAEKTFTLSEQTKKLLKNLDEEIKVTAFFSRNPTEAHAQRQIQEAEDLLERYARESKKIKLEFVDPYADPLKAQEYKVEFNGTTVFEHEGKRESVTSVDEQKFTSSIMKVIKDEIKKVYFLTGHGERSIEDYDRQGFNRAKEALEKQNYQVEELLLVTQPQIPDDCSAIIIANPQSPFSEHEIDSLKEYLDKKRGKALIMLDTSTSASDPNQKLIEFLDEWGVEIKNDLVLDSEFFYPLGKAVPYVDVKQFYHPITRDIQVPVPFAVARSVSPKEKSIPDITVTSIARTTEREGFSWGEKSRNEKGEFLDDGYTKGKDTAAPVSLAVAVQRERESSSSTEEEPAPIDTRLVVVGDSDFASNNEYFAMAGGIDFFLNSVNWLLMEEDLISIRPKPPEQRNLRPMLDREVRTVLLLSIFFIPRLVFILGLIVWWRRR
ncbi:Gldg family protein [bacterium]|nr:Gldg family protein [bacterium]